MVSTGWEEPNESHEDKGDEVDQPMTVDAGFWTGRRVMVTGNTGFKGSWLSLWLQAMGAEVTGLSNGIPTSPSLYKIAGIGELMTTYNVDICNRDAVAEVMECVRPEVVIHMAAQSLVRRSILEPLLTYDTNIIGTLNLLEAVRNTPDVKVMINVTSDKCYREQNISRGYIETDPMGGNDPYSSSKGCAELITTAYRESYFAEEESCAVASVRAGNVIGGGDWGEDRIVPDLINAYHSRRPLTIRNPKSSRPWQHVLNPLSGYLILAQHLWKSSNLAGGWNFGPNDTDMLSVSELTELFRNRWTGLLEYNIESSVPSHEVETLRIDSSNARAKLGWYPSWDVNQAVDAVVSWYERFWALDDMRSVTLRQISDFASVMREKQKMGIV